MSVREVKPAHVSTCMLPNKLHALPQQDQTLNEQLATMCAIVIYICFVTQCSPHDVAALMHDLRTMHATLHMQHVGSKTRSIFKRKTANAISSIAESVTA